MTNDDSVELLQADAMPPLVETRRLTVAPGARVQSFTEPRHWTGNRDAMIGECLG